MSTFHITLKISLQRVDAEVTTVSVILNFVTLAATYRLSNRTRVRERYLRIFDNFVNLASFGNFAFGWLPLKFYGKKVFIIITQFRSVGESSDRIKIPTSTCFINLKNCVTKSRYRSNDSFGNFSFRYLGSDIPTEQLCMSTW